MTASLIYTEARLVFLLKQNDRNAFEEFYDIHAPGMYGLILRIVKQEEVAQKLLDDSFLEIHRSIKFYDSELCSIYTWALKIARNKALSHSSGSSPSDFENTGRIAA